MWKSKEHLCPYYWDDEDELLELSDTEWETETDRSDDPGKAGSEQGGLDVDELEEDETGADESAASSDSEDGGCGLD